MGQERMETLAEKLAAGHAWRKQTNPQSHREIGNVDREPVKLLAASSAWWRGSGSCGRLVSPASVVSH
jgi:hypothetical protein